MTIEAWEGFWRHTREAAAHRAGGPQEAVLRNFWTSLFNKLLVGRQSLRVLDAACGNGAVLDYLFALVASRNGEAPAITAIGLDGSVAALVDLHKRLPQIATVAADVRRVPFAERTFDLVVSQFGVEYGGPDALCAAAPLVASGGTLAAVLHLRDGGIYRECALNLRAIEAARALLPRARETLYAGIAASRGEGDRETFRTADRRFGPAVAGVEAMLREGGKEVAGGVIHRLYADIGHIYKNLARFSADEVVTWLDRMSGEMDTYRNRMAGMLEAALDGQQVDELGTRLTKTGMCVEVRETLKMGPGGDAAWALVACRPPAPTI